MKRHERPPARFEDALELAEPVVGRDVEVREDRDHEGSVDRLIGNVGRRMQQPYVGPLSNLLDGVDHHRIDVVTNEVGRRDHLNQRPQDASETDAEIQDRLRRSQPREVVEHERGERFAHLDESLDLGAVVHLFAGVLRHARDPIREPGIDQRGLPLESVDRDGHLVAFVGEARGQVLATMDESPADETRMALPDGGVIRGCETPMGREVDCAFQIANCAEQVTRLCAGDGAVVDVEAVPVVPRTARSKSASASCARPACINCSPRALTSARSRSIEASSPKLGRNVLVADRMPSIRQIISDLEIARRASAAMINSPR